MKFKAGDRVHFEGRPATVIRVDETVCRVNIQYDFEPYPYLRKTETDGDWYDEDELLFLEGEN